MSGYIEYDDDEVIERKINNSVSSDEQETNILYMRNDKMAQIYTSDTTQMTKLDKLCKNSPDMYRLIEDTGRGKRYECADKTLISFRSKKTTRVMTDEQKAAAAKRLAESRAKKTS